MNLSNFPAQRFMQSLSISSRKEVYQEWISEIPYNWFETFVEYGLFPFLHSHGYRIGYTLATCIQYCKEWAFSHVLITRYGSRYKRRVFDTCYHSGGNDELDWYHHTIPTEEWFTFCSKWTTTDFLDESDPGQSQLYDIAFFVWHMIDLHSSSSHNKWTHHMDNLNQQYDDQWGYSASSEDMSAYGGDRRTM
jgi:hypothetical protein